MCGQVQNVVKSQIPDTDFLVDTARTLVDRVLPLHPELSPYGFQPGSSLENTVKEHAKEPDRATVASPLKVYPAELGKAGTGEGSVAQEKTIRFPVHPSARADLKYTGNKRYGTGEDFAKSGVARRRRAVESSEKGKSKPK